jgi:hypothetical protein
MPHGQALPICIPQWGKRSTTDFSGAVVDRLLDIFNFTKGLPEKTEVEKQTTLNSLKCIGTSSEGPMQMANEISSKSDCLGSRDHAFF